MRPAEGAGVGIGLSVSREVVLLHNGRIDARSAGVGRGSEFIVTLPLALSNAFLIDVLPPLVWDALPEPIDPDAAASADTEDLDRMDDDGGWQRLGETWPLCRYEQRPAGRQTNVVSEENTRHDSTDR